MMDNQEEIDLADVLRRLVRGLPWIIGSFLIVGVAFWATTLLMTPVYRATVVLVAADNTSGRMENSLLAGLGAITSMVGLGGGGTTQGVEEALAVMQSRRFSEKFIQEMNLMPKLFSDRWDADRGTWKGTENDQPTVAEGFTRFDTRVRKVVQDKKTGLIRLNIDWDDPRAAAKYANEIVSKLNSEMRDRAISAADASIRYLEEEIGNTSLLETRQNLNRLLEAQINRRMIATVTEQFAFRVVDPALPPDLKDIERPKKAYYLAAGGLLGLLLGTWIALSRAKR